MSNTSNNDISRSNGNITSNIVGRTSSMGGMNDMPESKSGTGTIN